MNISNSYRMNYNVASPKSNSKQVEQPVSAPVQNSYSPVFCGSSGYIILNSIRDSLNKSSSKSTQKSDSKTKNSHEPSHTYASEMDLKALDGKLYGTKVIIDGNKVSLNNIWNEDVTTVADIPEEYFEDCETEKDKEYLIKKWLVESKEDDRLENIPFELLESADKSGFYRLSNHSYYLSNYKQARANGIEIAKCEKANDDFFSNIYNVKVVVDKEPFDLVMPFKNKLTLVHSAANYDCDEFDLNPFYTDKNFIKVIKNIKTNHQCNIYRDGDKEYFIPKLLRQEPDLKNDGLIKFGNTDRDEVTSSEVDKMSRFSGKDLLKSDIKTIKYMEKGKFPEGKIKTAFACYDYETGDKYLYQEDKCFIKQTPDGEVFRIDLDK